MICFDLSEGMENCKMSGKSQGILKWMISGNPATFFPILCIAIVKTIGPGLIDVYYPPDLLSVRTTES